jgi:hypothetical protein
MKSLTITMLTCLTFSFGALNVNAQAVRKGDLMITGFSSYPNWGKFLMETALSLDNVDNYSVNGIPPSGLKLEFMLSNEMSFTLDGIYNNWKANWTSNNGYNNEVKLSRTRIQIGFNYHIPDLDSEDLDLYGGMAIGTNSRNVSFQSDNEFFDIDQFVTNPFVSFPLSSRLRFGGTYYLQESIGINFEIGTGGPVVGLGIVVKL